MISDLIPMQLDSGEFYLTLLFLGIITYLKYDSIKALYIY